jgi:hypothetical protein
VVVLLAGLSTLGKPFFSLLLSLAATRMILAGLRGGREQDSLRGRRRVRDRADGASDLRRAALALEDARQRELLPLFRRGAAAESFEGFETQLEWLEAEPGVRHQL